jgi:hypothetical protein
VKIKLDAAGRALLRAYHGRLGVILDLAPSPANTETRTVRLVQEEAIKAKGR